MSDKYLPPTIEFLELIGFKFGLDIDNALLMEAPAESIDPESILFILRQCEARIKAELNCRAERQRRQFIGGPLNGQRHYAFPMEGQAIARRVGRADWAAYRLGPDLLRAWYVGKATSEKKARELVYGPRPARRQTDEDEGEL